jgi:Flp pilus assembly protein TadB
MLPASLTLALGLILLCLGIAQMVRPFSGAPINPVLLIIVAMLLFLRYGLVRQRQKRLELMKEIPKTPLGLSGELEDKH